MRIELFRDAHHATIFRVLHQALHFHHDGLFHLGAGYFAGERGTLAALGGLCRCWSFNWFRCHHAFPLLCDRNFVDADFLAAPATLELVTAREATDVLASRGAAANSCARISVFTRARSFFESRKRFSASACPVVN